MRFIKLKIAATILTILVTFAGCKKESDTAGSTIVFEKQDYYPYEVALGEVQNINLQDGQYTGDIDGLELSLMGVDGSLVMVVPTIGAGIHTLNVSINGQKLSTSFNLLASPVISDPDAIVTGTNQTVTSTIQTLLQYADSLASTEKTQLLTDIQSLQDYQDSINQQYSSLSPEEKINCALFLSANQWWLNELHTASTDLLTASFTFKNQDEVPDYEVKVQDKINKYLSAKRKAVRGIKRVIGLTILGGVLGGGTPLGFTIGFGVGLGFLKADLLALSCATTELLETTLQPFDNIEASGKTNVTISFSNNSFKSVTLAMPYRSVYAVDVNSPVSIVKQFAEGLREVKTEWNKVADFLPFSNQLKLKAAEDIPNYKSANRIVNSKYVEVSDISNNNVSLSGTDKTDGYLKLKFTTTAQSTQAFTFKIKYSSELGQSVTTVDANIDTSTACSATCPATVTDIDGNTYNVVKIGCQCWTKENLKTEHYLNGDAITEIEDSTTWSYICPNGDSTLGWCNYGHDATNSATYGKLYNWHAAIDLRGFCPTGWHVPNNTDWDSLVNYLGGTIVAGGKMKTITLWQPPNSGANNSSEWSGVPGGLRDGYANFTYINQNGYWWSASEINANIAEVISLRSNNGGVDWWTFCKSFGLSVRCVKD
jgi:uncharacterized protein (TIGR02145 family)